MFNGKVIFYMQRSIICKTKTTKKAPARLPRVWAYIPHHMLTLKGFFLLWYPWNASCCCDDWCRGTVKMYHRSSPLHYGNHHRCFDFLLGKRTSYQVLYNICKNSHQMEARYCLKRKTSFSLSYKDDTKELSAYF